MNEFTDAQREALAVIGRHGAARIGKHNDMETATVSGPAVQSLIRRGLLEPFNGDRGLMVRCADQFADPVKET